MKFITYKYQNQENVGFVKEDRVYKVDVDNMIELIKSYEMVDFKAIEDKDEGKSIEELELLSPIVKPIHDILCVGKNYAEHILELGFELEEEFVATYFGKRAHRIMGPAEEIRGRFDLDPSLDYEAELAVIIGKECKNVSKDEALDYVFGFTVFNDLSSRELQMHHGQWIIGKSIDDYSAMGPWIVTKDEFDYKDKKIKSYVNGELRQNSTTKNMIMNVEEVIEELSRTMTLEAGDIITTGTPDGVGMGYNPPKFLKKGDKVRCEIEGIGSLENKIV